MEPDWEVLSLHPPFSTQDVGRPPAQHGAYPIPDTYAQSQSSANSTLDYPMSFRERHRFLDGIFNSYPETDLISAKDLTGISQRADLSMEEVLAWFGDEKARRSRLLAGSFDPFPVSPARTATPANSIVSLAMSHCLSSPGILSHFENPFSPMPYFVPQKVNVSAKRGRPPKNQYTPSLESSDPDSKRPKFSAKYPCPDCDNILVAERWSEHVRRVHFPDQVWECPKLNEKTLKPCASRPFFRTDNFATHLRGEHGCGTEEISVLKIACKFRTRNLFHQICGFCGDNFDSRDGSIEHIKNHFKEISERPHPPSDLGISEWQEQCKSDHTINRGVHYSVPTEAGSKPDRRHEEDDDGGAGGPGQGNPNMPGHSHFSNPQNGPTHQSDGTSDGGGDCYSYSYRYSSCHASSPKHAQGTLQDSTDGEVSAGSLTAANNNLTGPGYLIPELADGTNIPVEESTLGNLKESSLGNFTQHQSREPQHSSLRIILKNDLAIEHQKEPLSEIDSQKVAMSTLCSDVRDESHQYESLSLNTYPRIPVPPSVTARSQSLGISSRYISYPYAPFRRPSVASGQSHSSHYGDFPGNEAKEKGLCVYPDCGKVFKDLKAHMLSHQNERPEKCPIQSCDYHVKGFARKYDKNRHTLTHFKGKMVCGFCPGGGSASEKSFNRADVFKRHLTSVHSVEQTPPNSRRKLGATTSQMLSDYPSDATGKCSTCCSIFDNAQAFYEHLDDCVLRIVAQEEPSEAVTAGRLAEIPKKTFQGRPGGNDLPETRSIHPLGEVEDELAMDDEIDDDFLLVPHVNEKWKDRGVTHSKGGVTLRSNGRRTSKHYPPSCGCLDSQLKMKKRISIAFDVPARRGKIGTALHTEYKAPMEVGDVKDNVTILDTQSMRSLRPLDTSENNDLWIADELMEHELERLIGS